MTRYLVSLLLGSLCASCGGGGGGSDSGGSPNPTPPAPSPASAFSVSASNLSFVADDLLVGPRPYNLTGTVNISAAPADTLYVLIEIAGPAVQNVGSFVITSPSSGTALVYPQDPNILGVGTHSSTLTIRACLNSPTCATGQLSGSPRTVNVTYTVNAPVPKRDAVFPRFATSGQPADVVLRGTNLAATSSVSFGGQAAQSFTVVSSTEIRARHPALAAGTQPIALNSGTIAFNASLVVTDPQTFAATMLTYPSTPTPWTTPSPVYDAERKSIYLVQPATGSGPSYAPGPSRLLRYTYANGGWSGAQTATITGLRNVILGPTQSYLLGHTDDAVLEIDPVTLAVMSTYPLPADSWRFPPGFFFINNLTLTNDGYAVVTFGCNCGSADAHIYYFNTASHQFRLVQPNSYSNISLFVDGAHSHRAFVSGDGTRVLIGQYRYDPSTGGFARQTFAHGLRDNNVPPLVVMDRAASRLVVIGTIDPAQYASPKYIEIYDGNYQLLGRANEEPYAPVQDLHAVVSDDGRRLHVLHYDFLQEGIVALSTYDVGTASSTTFPLIGTRTTLPVMTRVSVDYGVTLTPDGKTLLIAGENGLFVQPIP